MEIEFSKSMFGFSQNCKLKIENKSDGVHVEVIDAEFPTIINDEFINYMVNWFRPSYGAYVRHKSERKEAANTGFLCEKIKELEDELKLAKFTQKIAKRNKVFIDGREV